MENKPTSWAQVKDDYCPNTAQPKSDYCEEHEYLEEDENGIRSVLIDEADPYRALLFPCD